MSAPTPIPLAGHARRTARAARAGLLVAALAAALGPAAGCRPATTASTVDAAREAIERKDTRAAEIHLKNRLQAEPGDVEARLMLAGLHAGHRDAASAEKEWRRALELGADPVRVLPGLVDALVQLDRPGDAIAVAQETPIAPARERAAVAYWVARANERLGRPVDAAIAYRSAIELAPDLVVARVGLIRLEAAADLPKALRSVDGILQDSPDLPDALLLRADLQIAMRDLGAARETLERAVRAVPADVALRLRLVGLLTELRAYDEAEARLEPLLRQAPDLLGTRLARGALDLARGRIEPARDAAQQILKSLPDHPRALVLAGEVALREGALEQVEAHARRLIDRDIDRAAGERLLAALHLRKGEYEAVVRMARRSAEQPRPDVELVSLGGSAAVASGDAQTAVRLFDVALRRAPDDPRVHVGRGQALLLAQRTDAGFEALERAASLDRSGRADLVLVENRLRLRQFAAALAAIDRLEAKLPGQAVPANLRGLAQLGLGRSDDALASFETALSRDPKLLAAVVNLARIDEQRGDAARARKRFDALVAADPRNAQALVAQAELLSRTGAPSAEVRRVLEQARSADPAAVSPALALAAFHVRSFRPEEAVVVLQKALTQSPDDTQLLEAIAVALARAGEPQQALRSLEQAVRARPGSARAHLKLAEMRASLGDSQGATSAYRRAAALEPGSPEANAGLASLLAREGKATEARRLAEEIVRAHPSSAAGWLADGEVAASQRRWTDAAASYRRAAALQPGPRVTIRLHDALLRANRPDEAAAVLRDALRDGPDAFAIRVYAGELAVRGRNWKAAVEHYDAALALQPEDIVALNNLAWSLSELNDPRAIEVAARAHARAPDAAAVLDTYGRILVAAGRSREGLDMIRRAVSRDERNPAYRLHHAAALRVSGDEAGARTQYESIVRDFPGQEAAKRAAAALGGPVRR